MATMGSEKFLFAAAGALVLLALPGESQAREYGKFGTVEIGGSFNAGQTTVDFGDEGGKATTLAGTVQPFAGIFVLPGFQVFANAEVGYANVKADGEDTGATSQTMGGGVGGAVLIGVGRARLGPSLAVRYIQETFEPDGGEAVDVRVGPGAEVAGVAKLQIGGGGIITVAVFASHDLLENETDGFSRTAVGTRGGFSIYF